MPDLIISKTKNPMNPNSLTFDENIKRLEEQERAEQDRLKYERQSAFTRWTQFNNEHTKELIGLAMKYPKAHAILYFLIDQMDNYNALVCSYQVIEDALGISKSTCQRAISQLKKFGFIAVQKSGSANVYTINDKVYWKSWGNNRQYSKFPANVVLAKSEQINPQLSFEDLAYNNSKEIIKKGKNGH